MKNKKKVLVYGILACLVNFTILYLFNEKAPCDEIGFVYTSYWIKSLLMLVTASLAFVVIWHVFWPMFRLIVVECADGGDDSLEARRMSIRLLFLFTSGICSIFLLLLFFNFSFGRYDTFTRLDLKLGMAESLILPCLILQSKVFRTMRIQADRFIEQVFGP